MEDRLPVHPPACLWEGRIEWSGDTAVTSVRTSNGIVHRTQFKATSREQLVRALLSTSWHGGARIIDSRSEINAVGHRIVHGGPHFEDPVVITQRYARRLPALLSLHHFTSTRNSRVSGRSRILAVQQIAVSDTGFHRQMVID